MKHLTTLMLVVCCCFVGQPATLAAADDPNEPGVLDDRDFRRSKAVFNGGDIDFRVVFYQPPNVGTSYTIHNFWIYISTDNNNSPDYRVTCHGSTFRVNEHTSGTLGREVYRGTPTVNGTQYTLSVPPKALGLRKGPGRNTLRYWFFWIAGAGSDSDRHPDSGEFRLNVKL